MHACRYAYLIMNAETTFFLVLLLLTLECFLVLLNEQTDRWIEEQLDRWFE